ncbi:type I methionyl aminopeptidase [Candidatus Dojkabacteria bacterium]|nr:type I methionyl aminopeptidase [Candidatus Dojkabacteria bacterium]
MHHRLFKKFIKHFWKGLQVRKDEEKIKKMREGGRIAASILRKVLVSVKPGVTTQELDKYAEDLCHKEGVLPAFKGYQDFPATLCVGPNDTVVHGIPGTTGLKEGDIVSIDFGIKYEGVYLDMARTVGVGKISSNAEKFIETVGKALENAIEEAKPGNTVGDIGYEIQSTVEEQGYSVVREMVGHGVGYKLHEEPMIPGYGNPGEGEALYEGQTLAIEAIVNQGSYEITISRKDGWTTKTKDGKLSALFENTVVVLEKPEILTPV